MNIRWSATTFAVLLAVPQSGVAQAICSAPHSSPTLAQSGSLTTLPPGAGWVQVSGLGQAATEFFNPRGTRQPFLANSEFRTRSVFATAAVGVAEGFELWTQVPFHRLSVQTETSGSSRSTGVGDVRVAARLGSALLDREWPLALRVGAKIPGSEFPVDATVLPLTEGQVDVEVSLESGWAIPDQPLYVMGWIGYRWRTGHAETSRDPGDERFGHLAFGGLAGALTWELAADGLWGHAPVALGIELEDEGRRLLQLLPTIGYGVGPGRVEMTAQLPLFGRNLPAGRGISVGYRTTWGL